MKCFLYARKSTDEPDRQMLSIEAQVTELREFARKERLTIVEEFTESMTARKPGRPIFNAMMDRVAKGEVDALLAWHPDRLGRNPLDGGRLIHALDSEALSTLKFPTFWFENTPQGRFMLAVSFGQAKLYVDDLSVNIRRGIRQKLRRGEFPGKPPVGYTNEPRLRTIVIDETKAPFVRRMFEDFATGEFSVQALRDRIIDWGLLSNYGQRPTLSKLYKTLANPFYVGLFRYKGELHEGTHEHLISQELFDEVQTILRQRSVPKSRRAEPFSFLGEIHCGECGCAITAERQKSYTYYRCTRKKGPCSMRFSREEAIENQLRQCTELVSLPDGWGRKPACAGRGVEGRSRIVFVRRCCRYDGTPIRSRGQALAADRPRRRWRDYCRGVRTQEGISPSEEDGSDRATCVISANGRPKSPSARTFRPRGATCSRCCGYGESGRTRRISPKSRLELSAF